MITETTAVTLRQNLGDMLNRVQYRRDSIVITKDGKPVAALVDAALFQRIRAMQGRFDALCDRIAKGYESVSDDEGMAEIERVSARARRETSDQWRSERRLPPPPLALAAKTAPPRSRATKPQHKAGQAKSARANGNR